MVLCHQLIDKTWLINTTVGWIWFNSSNGESTTVDRRPPQVTVGRRHPTRSIDLRLVSETHQQGMIHHHGYCYYSLTHCCAWPAEGHGDLHNERSRVANRQALMGRPISSSTCWSQVLCWWPGISSQWQELLVPILDDNVLLTLKNF